MPYGSRRGDAVICKHEGLGPLSLSGGDRRHRPPGGYGAVVGEQRILVAGACVIVPMFDQEPIDALFAVAITTHANEHPAAAQALSLQSKFELAGGKRPPRALGTERAPVAAIPQLHSASTVLTLGNA